MIQKLIKLPKDLRIPRQEFRRLALSKKLHHLNFCRLDCPAPRNFAICRPSNLRMTKLSQTNRSSRVQEFSRIIRLELKSSSSLRILSSCPARLQFWLFHRLENTVKYFQKTMRVRNFHFQSFINTFRSSQSMASRSPFK